MSETPTPRTDAVRAAIREWEKDPRLYAHTAPPKSLSDHANDLERELAAAREELATERVGRRMAQEELAHASASVGLWRERAEKAEAELAELRPQIALDRAMIEDQGRRLDAAVKDAERYRWLKENSPGGWRIEVDGLPCWKHDLDAAIDAAKAKEAP